MFEILLLFVFVGIPLLFIFGMYFLGKKLQSKKTGIILSTFFGVLYLGTVFYFSNEDLFFSKSNAREILNSKKIYLKDDFKIVENKSSGWIGDYNHTFTIKISDNDKQKLSNDLKRKIDSNEVVIKDYPKSDKRFYKINSGFVEEFPMGDMDDSEKIVLYPTKNLLTYELNIE